MFLIMMGTIAGVQAEEKGMTKEQFLASYQKRAEAAGKAFDKAKAEALFNKRDINKDGILSAAERELVQKKLQAK